MIRHRLRPKLLRHCGQNPLATHSAQGSSPFLPLPEDCQHGATLRLVTPDSGRRALDTAPVLQSFDRVGKLRRRICGLGGRSMYRHRVFRRRYLVHELVFACNPPPPPRSQISHIILSQAERCAIRAVAVSSQPSRPWSREPECFGIDRLVTQCCAAPWAPQGDHFSK